MTIILKPYLEQSEAWPASGSHILAQYDDESIIVYQAYKPAITQYAVEQGYFGHGFKLDRMSWIKPNFLWMMHRCGWASKEGQERVLAIRLKREAFDAILAQAVHSSYKEAIYANHEQWRLASRASDVVMQWDPDHGPTGAKQERRAIQLGLRGAVLAQYAKEWIVEIEDITEFVHSQSPNAAPERWEHLTTPFETVYDIPKDDLRAKILS